MNKKHTRNLFAFALISFLSLSAMEEGESRPSVKRKNSTISNENLALFETLMPKDMKKEVADRIYDQIDPYFISNLLCERITPKLLVQHSKMPYISCKQTDKATIFCHNHPYCHVSRTIPISGREHIHSNNYSLSKRTYHSWKTIQKSSVHHRLALPRFMLKAINNNLISIHWDHSVYEWSSEPIEQRKKDCAHHLSYEEVLLLQFMQHTHDPLDNKAKQIVRKNLPRHLRSIQRAKKQKATEATT